MKVQKLLLFVAAMIVSVSACGKSNDGDGSEVVSIEHQISGFFEGERRPNPMSCFAGAYYRKCVTSKDVWTGITGTVVLPLITFDQNRPNPAKPGQYLDNPSVYMGGNANGQETDIGMTWEVIKVNGVPTADRRAFRPFLRRTGYSGTSQGVLYENAPAEDQFYWYPGEEVALTLKLVANRTLRFTVEGAGKRFERDFQCDGYSIGSYIEFKRVNAIDQVANEGKPAQETMTKVEGSRWTNTYLFRQVKGIEYKAPMHSGRFTDMRCPDTRFFIISATDEQKQIGAESIVIDGGL